MTILPPSISVVVPVYNRRVSLGGAIHSALNQSLLPEEIVIVDDASSDGSYEVAHHLSHEHPRIRVLRHSANQGGSAARNTGWRAATGELVAFLDSDDRWLPHKLEKQAEAIQMDQAFGLAFCGYRGVSGPNRGTVYVKPAPATTPWNAFRHELACGNAVGTASVPMIRRSLLEAVGGFNPDFPSCQDWELWYRLSAICRFVAIDEVLVDYTLASEGRISTSIDKVMAGHRMMFDLVRREYGGELPSSVEASHLALSGNLYRNFGHFRKAADCYTQSFRAKPSLYIFKRALGLLARAGESKLRSKSRS